MSTPAEPIVSQRCQRCNEVSGVEQINIFGVSFTVCAYCRGEAKDTLASTYIWRRQPEIKKERSWFGGSVVVFDGNRELIRRGFGVQDH